MRTRALCSRLNRLEARLAERLRVVKPNEEPCPWTIEERCAGLCYVLRRSAPWPGFPPEAERAIAEFQEARKQRPVPEALTERTWDLLTKYTTPLLRERGYDVGPPESRAAVESSAVSPTLPHVAS